MPEKPERWIELAELAANEQDPERVLELAKEINQMLEKENAHCKDGERHPETKPLENPATA